MGTRGNKLRRLAPAVIAAGVALSARAQIPLQDGADDQSNQALIGKPAIDMMPGKRKGLGYPLRFGGVVEGSVAVEVSGRSLKEGSDFSVDYAGGVVYISADIKDSDSIRVRYRHDSSGKASSGGSALPLLTLNFGHCGSMTMLLGMGGAERFDDGRVMQSQNIGMQNNFLLGNTSVSGLYMVNSRSNSLVSADDASPDDGDVKQGNEGASQLIMQKAATSLGNGMKFSANYQRVDTNFDAFSALSGSGVDDATAQQLEKEKGISRFGLGLAGGSEKGLSFSNSFSSIDDGKGRITFHDYGVKSSLFNFYVRGRNIDSTFSRFGDIAEADRAQFQKERGIDRNEFGGGFNFGKSSLTFSDNRISQEDDAAIDRRSLSFEGPWVRAAYTVQNIDAGFARARDLAEGERDQWGRERGFRRRDFSMALPKTKDKDLLSFSQQSIAFDQNSYRASEFRYNGGKFGVDFWSRSSSPGFVRFSDMTAGEKKDLASRVLETYDLDAAPNDNDINWLNHEAGLSRDYLRLSGSPLKGGHLSFETSGISDPSGGIKNDVIGATFGTLNFNYRRMNIDSGFTRLFDLMEAERKFYGNQVGFDRTDWSLDGKFAKTDFSFSGMGIGAEKGHVSRTKASLKGQGFEFNAGMRSIDSSFDRVGDINDPEHDFLSDLVGYKQNDYSLKLSAIRNLNVDAMFYDANNGDDDMHRYKRAATISYAPDKLTQFAYQFNNYKLDGAAGSVYADDFSSFRGSRDFGKLGKLSLTHESESFAGSNKDKPDRTTDYAKYENNLTKALSFSTEQARTEFADGGYENIQSYKLGWQITKKFGVNVEQMMVDRDKLKNDQNATNFGFSYDFGNNLKLGYTWQHNLDTAIGGKHTTHWELSPGSFGGFNMGGGFTENGSEGQRNSRVGNFTLSNPKPFNFGFLKDVKLSLGYDGETQVGIWQRERRVADFSALVGSSSIEFGYTHVLLPGQQIGADRFAKFNLDPSGKNALQVGLGYKVRTMPDGGNLVMQDFDLAYKIGDRFVLSHKTDNFPEQAQNGSPLGTQSQPTRSRTWALDYLPNKDVAYKFAFQELQDLNQHTMSRKADLTTSFFNKSGSPIRLTYGIEQNDNPAFGRRTRAEYQVSFEQKPGPNQTFSLTCGTVDWADGIADGQLWHRVLMNLDYQLRF